MFIAYLIVTVVTAAANVFSATLDFIRYKQISINMARVGVPESWMPLLGILKAAAAVGLLVGIGVPFVGASAALGLVCFFVGALVTHLRARDYSFGLAVVFLALAVATLALTLHARAPVAFAGVHTRIPHTHRDYRMATVVSGEWHFGYGTHFDEKSLKELSPGVCTQNQTA